ncbi:MAG: potassium-transporting ATPase subunit KdpC [Thermodesulfobacteriota bacterium]
MTAEISRIVKTAFLLLSSLTVITGLVYPVSIHLLAQAFFNHQANGGPVSSNGRILGSELIGQSFGDPKYFWGRPSATTPYPYNAAFSTGSNQGPTNPEFLDAVGKRLAVLKKTHPEASGPIPMDLVTASASGLDPHLSPAAANYQARRVAKARGLSESQVTALIRSRIEDRQFGILGQPRVNILKLNLALNDLESGRPSG